MPGVLSGVLSLYAWRIIFPIPAGSQTLARGRDPETRSKNESDPEGVAYELDDGRDQIRFPTVMIFLIRRYLAPIQGAVRLFAKSPCVFKRGWGFQPQSVIGESCPNLLDKRKDIWQIA